MKVIIRYSLVILCFMSFNLVAATNVPAEEGAESCCARCGNFWRGALYGLGWNRTGEMPPAQIHDRLSPVLIPDSEIPNPLLTGDPKDEIDGIGEDDVQLDGIKEYSTIYAKSVQEPRGPSAISLVDTVGQPMGEDLERKLCATPIWERAGPIRRMKAVEISNSLDEDEAKAKVVFYTVKEGGSLFPSFQRVGSTWKVESPFRVAQVLSPLDARPTCRDEAWQLPGSVPLGSDSVDRID